jgi:murein DD-endopeptidase MepM/ murein hydrolase activator NlpD
MNLPRALRTCAWLGLAAGKIAGAADAAPALHLPIDCTPGETCWIANHVDLDPGSGARDYACGRLTYDAHSGTDIAVRDLAAMRAGVKVLAAAAGVVRGVRDGVEDISVRERAGGRSEITDRECGNGVRIDHGGGWQTQYCHLRRGSVAVRPGETVSAGQALGLVGLSGMTEYPHLHFGVRRDAASVDPFGGEPSAQGCAPASRPLWDAATLAALPYSPGVIYNFGVATGMPPIEQVREGRYRGRRVARDAQAIVVWAEVFGTGAGEVLRFTVEAPDGSRFLEQRAAFERPQARAFRAFGRKRGAQPWSPGTYRVTIAYEQRQAEEPPAGMQREAGESPAGMQREAGPTPAGISFNFEIE